MGSRFDLSRQMMTFLMNLIVPQRNTKFLVIYGKFLSTEQLWRSFNNHAQWVALESLKIGKISELTIVPTSVPITISITGSASFDSCVNCLVRSRS
jgi:hypothetical protein